MVSKVHKTFMGLVMQSVCQFNCLGFVCLFFQIYVNMNVYVDLNCLFSLYHRLTEWAGLHWKEPFHWGSGVTVDLFLRCLLGSAVRGQD